MPMTTSPEASTSSTQTQPASAATPQGAIAAIAGGTAPWWAPQWEAQQAWALSYWQVWQTVAWVPWNMMVSAWQIADGAAHKEPQRGVLHSAMGEIDLNKAQ